MIAFSELFTQHQSDIIQYGGETIHRYFLFENFDKLRLKLTFVSSNSKYGQAIVVHFQDNFKGRIYLDGRELGLPKSAFPHHNFWKETAPAQFLLEIIREEGKIWLCNGADPIGDHRFCKNLSGGCAMKIQELGKNHYRCHCNDHVVDDDFDDLVYDVCVEYA